VCAKLNFLSIGLFGGAQFESFVLEASIASALLPADAGTPLSNHAAAALGGKFHILSGAGHLYTDTTTAVSISNLGQWVGRWQRT